MANFAIPLSIPGLLLKPQTTIQFGLWELEGGAGTLLIQAFGLHWIKSNQPRSPLKVNLAQPAVWAGIWTGDGAHVLGPSGSPLVQVGLDGQGFSGKLPGILPDAWGANTIWAALTNNTTNLDVIVTVTGVANWVSAEPVTTSAATQTTSTSSSTTVVITNSPTQVVV